MNLTKLDPMPTSAEFDALAKEYQAGLEKCMASGYEEFGPDFQRRQQMIVAALRAASALRALSELGAKASLYPLRDDT